MSAHRTREPLGYSVGPLVSVEALTSRSHRFRCPTLRAELAAGACLARQSACIPHRSSGTESDVYPTCARCSLGDHVRALVAPETLRKTRGPRVVAHTRTERT